MVGDQGFEPRMSWTPVLQTSAVANAARHPKLAMTRIAWVKLPPGQAMRFHLKTKATRVMGRNEEIESSAST
jgi:hypothetical protein